MESARRKHAGTTVVSGLILPLLFTIPVRAQRVAVGAPSAVVSPLLPDAPTPQGAASAAAYANVSGARLLSGNSINDATDESDAIAALDLGQLLQDSQSPKPNPAQSTGRAPSSSSSAPSLSAPSLSDLGLSSEQVKGNAQQQALLDKRTRMLKIHQRLGLITAVPMAVTAFTGGGAKTKNSDVPGGRKIIEPSSASLDFHAALGGLTTVMYVATAYYAIRAPRVKGTQTRGAIRLHRALAWVHGPGMVLTPILGAMAANQENNGEKVHGIASAHSGVAVATIVAYGAAILSVSWPIKVNF